MFALNVRDGCKRAGTGTCLYSVRSITSAVDEAHRVILQPRPLGRGFFVLYAGVADAQALHTKQ
ncbi:hypothetical protein VU13_04675, partial [Desulfobulbus sp. US5]|nr:hypothetical protein [Desulfobulbus sp. US5]